LGQLKLKKEVFNLCLRKYSSIHKEKINSQNSNIPQNIINTQ